MQSHYGFLTSVRWTNALFVVIVLSASSACAVTETILHSFAGPDGAQPYAELISDSSGNLYGTTAGGRAFGYGTVFELSPSAGGWTETVLHSFGGSPDGAAPFGGLVFDNNGNLYGMTNTGGNQAGAGTVFELTPSGSEWTETIIHIFGSVPNDGCYPVAGLTIDSNGNLYGITPGCGAKGYGTIFELSFSGGVWSESILWSFNSSDGYEPEDGLVFDSAGNLYTTTLGGGFYGVGNVFKLTLVSGIWTGISIFSFTGGDNGCQPFGSVIPDKVGNVYGTTEACGADLVGTVFKLTPTEGQWTMSVLHTFTGGIDGGRSSSELMFDSAGNLYGTTQLGGLFGSGTVFELTPKNGGTWTEAEYSFTGGSADGSNPHAGISFGTGAVFGTTLSGGSNGLGTVYEITANCDLLPCGARTRTPF